MKKIVARPEFFPESVVERIRAIAEAYPAAEGEVAGGALGTVGSGNVFRDLGLPDADRLMRESHVREAIASAEIEDLSVSAETRALLDRYVAGEITIEGALAAVKKAGAK